jgi:Phage integrase family
VTPLSRRAPAPAGRRVDLDPLDPIRDRHRDMLGVKLSPHKLRHNCASYLLLNGAQLETIQRHLGHQDVKTTMIYLHVPQKRQDDEISQAFGGPPVFPPYTTAKTGSHAHTRAHGGRNGKPASPQGEPRKHGGLARVRRASPPFGTILRFPAKEAEVLRNGYASLTSAARAWCVGEPTGRAACGACPTTCEGHFLAR